MVYARQHQQQRMTSITKSFDEQMVECRQWSKQYPPFDRSSREVRARENRGRRRQRTSPMSAGVSSERQESFLRSPQRARRLSHWFNIALGKYAFFFSCCSCVRVNEQSVVRRFLSSSVRSFVLLVHMIFFSYCIDVDRLTGTFLREILFSFSPHHSPPFLLLLQHFSVCFLLRLSSSNYNSDIGRYVVRT